MTIKDLRDVMYERSNVLVYGDCGSKELYCGLVSDMDNAFDALDIDLICPESMYLDNGHCETVTVIYTTTYAIPDFTN